MSTVTCTLPRLALMLLAAFALAGTAAAAEKKEDKVLFGLANKSFEAAITDAKQEVKTDRINFQTDAVTLKFINAKPVPVKAEKDEKAKTVSFTATVTDEQGTVTVFAGKASGAHLDHLEGTITITPKKGDAQTFTVVAPVPKKTDKTDKKK